MKVAMVVPRRSGIPERDAAWAWCYEWWKQFDFPILPVEHPGPEPFNRSWCINTGARELWPWDVLIIVDSDTIEEKPSQVPDAINRCYESGRLTVGHTGGKDLHRVATDMVVAGQGDQFNWDDMRMAFRPRCDSRVNLVRADLFERVGGLDARFRGWGHEDYCFVNSCTVMAGPKVWTPGNSWHLWHPKMTGTAPKTTEWQEGLVLAKRYLQATDPDLLQPILDERTPEQRWTRP